LTWGGSRLSNRAVVRLSLIQPPLSARRRYGGLAGAGNSLPNLGMLQLAAVARRAGAGVQLLDLSASDQDVAASARRVAEFAPALVGLTAVTAAMHVAAGLAEALKRLLPNTPIVLGGPHVTAAAEQTLQRYGAFDAAVLGEGETTLLELLAALESGADWKHINGLLLRERSGLRRTAPRALIEDLDSLPLPAWDLLPELTRGRRPSPQSAAGGPAAILFTSRGCPFKCTFCDRSVFGNRVRSLSAGRVVQMITHLAGAYGVRDFAIHDEIFVLDRARLHAICRGIIESGIRVSWNAQGRADRPLDAETLELMRRAGCWQLQIGVESGDPRILESCGKGITPDQVRRAFRAARAAGLATKAFYMLGLPGEDEQSLNRTLELALELPLDDVTVTLFTPFPGTAAAIGLERHGRVLGDWSTMSEYEVSFVPQGLSAERLLRARAELLRRFYLRPRVIARYAKRLAQPRLAGALARGGLAFVALTTRRPR